MMTLDFVGKGKSRSFRDDSSAGWKTFNHKRYDVQNLFLVAISEIWILVLILRSQIDLESLGFLRICIEMWIMLGG